MPLTLLKRPPSAEGNDNADRIRRLRKAFRCLGYYVHDIDILRAYEAYELAKFADELLSSREELVEAELNATPESEETVARKLIDGGYLVEA